MNPRVSVVVPTRNRLSQLQRAISAVRNQTFRDFEVIVVVDGSTDDTLPWLQSYGAGLHVLTKNNPIGAAAARNSGIAHARGELIAFLDDDDVWRASYLEAQVAHLDSHPGASLSYTDHVNVDSKGEITWPKIKPLLRYESDLLWLLSECFIHSLSIVVCRRELFEEVGVFDPDLMIVHDLEWYARLLMAGRTFTHLSSALVQRSVPGGLVTSHRKWFREESAVLTRVLDNSPAKKEHECMIRAYRALFFAHLAIVKLDFVFGLARLLEALTQFSHWTMRAALLRLRHQRDVR